MQLPPRTRDSGVDQFAREHAAVAGGEQQPDFFELRALGLVHGHGEGAVVRGQRGVMEGARRIGGVAGEPDHDGAAGVAREDVMSPLNRRWR